MQTDSEEKKADGTKTPVKCSRVEEALAEKSDIERFVSGNQTRTENPSCARMLLLLRSKKSSFWREFGFAPIGRNNGCCREQ